MRMDRRSLLRGLVGTAAGVLVAPDVLAEPERRVWALDSSMVNPMQFLGEDYNYYQRFEYGVVFRVGDEIMWRGPDRIYRGQARTQIAQHEPTAAALVMGHVRP